MLRDVHMALFATETKVETTQMAINKELAVQRIVCLYYGELRGCKKDWGCPKYMDTDQH